MKRLTLILLTLCLITTLSCSSSKVAIYTIEISGTDGLAFSGSYGGLSSGGVAMKSVEGRIPAEYRVEGTGNSIISCSFFKLERAGTLNVYIYKDGEIITQGGTSAAFGSVTLSGK